MKVLQQLVDAAAQRWISLDRVFDVADSDLSGTISQDELIGLLSKLDLKNVNIDNLWSSLDTDGDGELSKQEWQDTFEGIKPTETATVSITWNVKPSYQKHIPGGLVALIAHNKMKAQMAAFVKQNIEFFKFARIVTTGSTGKALESRLGLSVY